jgi:hypothetical protein
LIIKFIHIFLFPIYLLAEVDIASSLVNKENDNSFITKYEYGKMLYENPRGISCKQCHGNNAQGKKIVKFVHKVKDKIYNCEVKTKDLRDVKLIPFLDKLNPEKKLKKVKFLKEEVCEKLIYGNTMPKYFLTNDELDSLYYYITNVGLHNE